MLQMRNSESIDRKL